MEYPQHNETNSVSENSSERLDLQAVNYALTALQSHAESLLDTIRKDLHDFYSTDIEVIRFVDKEIMKKIIQFKQDIQNIIVYSRNLQAMHETQGRLFYD